jgi:predicted alpha/beta superfamily hydrolase
VSTHNKTAHEAEQADVQADAFVFDLTTLEDDDRPIKVVGNFNHWNLNFGAVHMDKVAPFMYRGTLAKAGHLPRPLEYRYTKGTWQDLEVDEYGTLPHHHVVEDPRAVLRAKDEVKKWMLNGVAYDESKLPKIEVIAQDFEMPQLIKTRRIAAVLPWDYYLTDKHYPVLYLQDGQNLLDEYAPFGTWGLDKKLAAMAGLGTHEFIVITIDHAKEQRIQEFTPSHSTKLGFGDGKKYARFLADTLKPYVDKQFRTLRDREHTGIGGSSMGGLVSLYAGFLYPEVYSKMMIFSPSLWVDPEMLGHFSLFHDGSESKVYVYAGGSEGPGLLNYAHKLIGAFEYHRNKGWNLVIKTSFNPQGRHNEADWGKEFPRAVEWLFFNR